MSSSCSDCFSDLICDEDVGILSGVSLDKFQDLEFPDYQESITVFMEEESYSIPISQSESVNASARQESIAWILKVQAFYSFEALTAYLAVNYMDRFLASRSLPQANGWPMQLLSIACLSLAAKMEEPLVPSLVDLQVEGTKYIFVPQTVRRMELLVLTTLDWRLRSITPFTFFHFFASKVDPSSNYIGFLISRATRIILTTIQEISVLHYMPSSVAVASILHAATEIPSLSVITPENAASWCQGLRKDRIIGCYQLMGKLVMVGQKQRRPPKVLPQHRVMTHTELDSGDSSSFSSSKRRKLNNYGHNDNP